MAAQHAADGRRNGSAVINRAESDLRRNARFHLSDVGGS
jgi:hypothetical protein